MLTPKIRNTNIVKTHSGFKVGEFARSKAFGTRVYKVLAANLTGETVAKRGLVYDAKARGIVLRYWEEKVMELRLIKVGETNKGRFKFTNGRPFTVAPGALHWYYPAKGV